MNDVWLDIKQTQNKNKFFVPLLLLVCTIVFPLGINNVALGLLMLFVLFYRKTLYFQKSYALIIPVVLFLWMGLSYGWSIDKERTIKALPKEISLLLIPMIFLFIPELSSKIKKKIIKGYSYSIVFIALFFVLRAVFRYFTTNQSSVFFYHGEYNDDFGFVPKSLNAIYFSVFVSVAYFDTLAKEIKNTTDRIILIFLSFVLLLLSSKNILVIFILLNLIYFFFFSKVSHKMRLRNIVIVILFIIGLLSFSNIKDRFLVEFQSNTDTSLNSNVVKEIPNGVHYVSIYEAWNNEIFTPNDFFPGTAFRIYQVRLFFDFLKEESIFWKGFGLNASSNKLEEKGYHYNVFLGDNLHQGYQKKNFHNQYIQNFAELGIIGFLLLVTMLIVSSYKMVITKDFVHIAFTVLMISLFLTESFLWRQRGVVFFTIFYSLFVVSKQQKKS